jgi:glycosyltransferase involved in cell wall biosynthesis
MGIDFAAYEPSVAAPARPHPSEPLRVLMASRLIQQKGVQQFLQAAQESKDDNVDMLLAGSPDPGNPYSLSQSDLESWNQSAGAQFLRHVENMVPLLLSVYVVVLPTYYPEGLPRILIEAVAASCALVAAELPQCEEIAVSGFNALLILQASAHKLVDALRTLNGD